MTVTLDDRIRNAFAFRVAHTDVARDPAAGFGDTANVGVRSLPTRRPRRWQQPMAVAAAIVAVGLVGGVVVQLGHGSDPPTPTVPPGATPVTPVASGLLAISLDGVPHVGGSPVGDGVLYDVPDTGAMQAAGWWVSDIRGYPGLSTDGGSADAYVLRATVTSPRGARFELAVERGGRPAAPGPGDRSVEVDGVEGWIVDARDGSLAAIWWGRDDLVLHVSATTSDTTDDALVSAAEALRFRQIDVLAVPGGGGTPSDGTTPPVAGAPEFAGILDGVAWSADVGDSTLRALSVTVPELGTGGGFELDRRNQPTDDPATDADLTLVGFPDHGALAVGWAPPAASMVHVLVDDTSVAVLPLYRRPGESFFVVPIPDGLVVNRLVFVDAMSVEVAIQEVPAVAPGFSGTSRID